MVPKILDSLERANAFDSIGGGQSLEYVIHFILNTVKDIITTNLPIATPARGGVDGCFGGCSDAAAAELPGCAVLFLRRLIVG